MKKKFFILISIFLLLVLVSQSVFSENTISSFYFYNFYFAGTSYGYTGLSDFTNPFGFIINPSINANIYLNNINLSVIGFGNYLGLGVFYFFPTDIGNFSFYLNYLHNNPVINGDLTDNIYFKANFSKLISDFFYLGFALNIYTMNFQSFGAGIDIGATYILSQDEDFEFFSFKNIAFAGVIKNIGLPIVNTTGVYPPIGIGAGISFDFFRIKNILNIRNNTDIYLYFYSLGVNFLSSIDLKLFNIVDIYFGVNIGTFNSSLNPINYLFFGIQGNIPIGDSDLTLSYSYTPSFSNSYNSQHTVMINYNFGEKDTQPPEVEIRVDKNVFSPNYDGNKDELNIYPKFKDNKLIYGWKVVIYDSKGNVVKEFIGEDVRKIRFLTLEKIFKRLFAKKEAVKLPESLIWDGTNSKGKTVPDGKYKIQAIAWDERNNIKKSDFITVTVDTKICDIKISKKFNANDKIFSPNGDGKKDLITVPIALDSLSSQDTLIVNIYNEKGNLINTYKFDYKKLKNGKFEFKWDGKDKKGKIVDEGLYRIEFKIEDPAGNQKSVVLNNISVITHYETLRTFIPENVQEFSPNGDGQLDSITFQNKISSKNGLIKWKAVIYDKNGNIVKEYEGDQQNFPDKIVWNGLNNEGKKVKDGEYYYQIKAYYNSGNEPESNKVKVIVDTTPPVAEVKLEYNSFSPNNDGKKDTLPVEIVSKDINDIKDVALYNADTDDRLSSLKYKHEDDKILINWDGNDEEGNPLPQGNYNIKVVITDKAGNKKVLSTGKIKLVRELEKVFANATNMYYSPNGDGVKDKITFKFDAETKNGLVKSEFMIEDKNKTVIFKKSFKGLPDSYTFHQKLKDGKYYYYIKVTYDNGNTPTSVKKPFYVDTKKPEVEVAQLYNYFSPNNDGIKDNNVFKFKLSEKLSEIDLDIFNFNNKENVKNIKIDPSLTEFNFNGQDLKDGKYNFVFKFVDLAGNSVKVEKTVFINREKPESFEMVLENDLVSPNNDGYLDTLNLKVILNDKNISNIDQFKSIEFYIIDLTGKVVFKNISYTKINTFKYDSRNKNGKLLEDGQYKIYAKVNYMSGVSALTSQKAFFVDNTKPQAKVVIKPDYFSPDNDGEKDKLYISFNAKDNFGLQSYEVKIYRLYSDNTMSKKPFKIFKGNLKGIDSSAKIVWDGKGDKPGSLVDSASDYVAIVRIKDKAGNINIIKKKFYVDILVIKTALGYKIMINSIEFDFNSYKLKKSAIPILNRVIQILQKFKNYKVLIVGYTDSIGDEKYNLWLSKMRAKSVYDYLVTHDIDPARLSYTGMGEAYPIDTNDTEDGRRRNRRVEFYLEKQKNNNQAYFSIENWLNRILKYIFGKLIS